MIDIFAIGLVLLIFAIGLTCVAVPAAKLQEEERAQQEQQLAAAKRPTDTLRANQIRNAIALDVEAMPAQEDDPHEAITLSQSIVHQHIEQRYWNRVILPRFDTEPMEVRRR